VVESSLSNSGAGRTDAEDRRQRRENTTIASSAAVGGGSETLRLLGGRQAKLAAGA
jgi:hypothetical protein